MFHLWPNLQCDFQGSPQGFHPAQNQLCFISGQLGKELFDTRETNRGCLLRATGAPVSKPYYTFI